MTEAPTFNCSVCGAPAQAGDVSCRFCGAGIATVRCSRCFHMNMSDAHRCSGCGAELGLIVESKLVGKRCSECGKALEAMHEPGGTLLACRHCGGQFVEHALLRSLIEQYEMTALAFPDAPYHKPALKIARERVHYRPCSICQQMMNRKNFGGSSGVIVDVCTKHGTWFDVGELPQILEFVKSGGLVRERVRETERKSRALAHEREIGGAPLSLDSLSVPAHSSFAADLFQFIVEVLKHH
ncbi:MAG TPA: zf-TFIIB domain-containing protein [Polyangiaceae bacterium]|jgi:Zn-finger nucleic acid-binding protein